MADQLVAYQQAVEGWTQQQLAPYQERLTSLDTPPGPKEFNDPVWGTVVLHPLEILVLDSPIHQRLRRIKQLGVVHLVYPAATHTRLEHTIGVLHQADALVSSINSHHAADEAIIPDRMKRLLRLTGLCHDLGHGAMSHVSQNALMRMPDAEDLRNQFIDEVQQVDKVSLSEMAAYYIVGSPAYREVIATAQAMCPLHELPPDPCSLIQSAIIGSPISTEVPLLHELISGPFDADKLDYMTRDAYMTGVPVVTDVTRLVQKVRAVRKPLADLPIEIAATIADVEAGPAAYAITGLALSGARTLDELLLGRVLLFDKLYRHQKVRAIEEMVSTEIRLLAEVLPPTDRLLLPLRLSDDDLIAPKKSALEELLPEAATTEAGPAALDRAREIGEAIRDRNLWVRGFAFAQNMPLDPHRHDPAQSNGLTKLDKTLRDHELRHGLTAKLIDEVRAVLAALEVTDLQDVENALAIDPPKGPPEPNDLAYLISPSGTVLKFKDEYAETANWVNAYHLTRDVGYVFCRADLAHYVFLAAERILRMSFDVRTPSSMMSYVRSDRSDIRDLKLKLEATGYYDGLAMDLRPPRAVLLQGDTQKRLIAITERMQGYSGPVRQEETLGKASLNHQERIQQWLQQFTNDDLAKEALRILEHVVIVGRREVALSVWNFLGTQAGLANAVFTRFGELKDSSSVVTYWLGDVTKETGHLMLDLPQAVRLEQPIIMVDDFIGSGRQAVTVIETLLGLPPSYPLGEAREPLGAAEAEMFRARSLKLVFAAGTDEGRQLLQNRVSELGLDAQVFVGRTDLPTFESLEVPPSSAFIEHCNAIGGAVLDDGEHDADWIADRTLGYGNKGFLVVFEYNTPTHTLTALWKSGTFNGAPWTALYPRRKKP